MERAFSSFSKVGEFRKGKGNKSTRLGPRVRIETGGISSAPEKKKQTPQDIAVKNLVKLLPETELPLSDRNVYVDYLSKSEQLRFMNMAVLAQVVLHMRSFRNVVNDETSSAVNVNPRLTFLINYFDKDAASLSSSEKEIIRVRMYATFLRYLDYVVKLMQE